MTKSKANRASLGVALICRNAAATLGPCLASLRPYVEQIVVGIDETTTDKTAKVARRWADKIVDIQVSDFHECPFHGRILVQHFGNARNQSFAHLDQGLDWWMWIDADDVLKGGERLADLVAAVPEYCVGVWLPYHYATMREGKLTNTLFDRERILRSNVGWKWEYRVHEVVTPQREHPQWIRAADVAIYHQEGVHKTDNSAQRNLTLLEIDLEANPDDSRATFYMGNQYFALGRWAEATEWYERLCSGLGTNPYELWQSYCYLSMAYERMGDVDSALKAAFGAIDVRPEHPEPYFRLAAVYCLSGEHEKALYWTQEGRKRPEPPFFVFKNPLDYTFNNRMVAADSLASLGRVPEARRELEEAAKVLPGEAKIDAALAHYRSLEASAQQATSISSLLQGKPDAEIVRLWTMLDPPPEVRQFGRCRDMAVGALLRGRLNTQPRVIFFCGRSLEEWYPGSLNSTGIGGSETAVIEIARRFAADGWRVDVYNGAGRYEGFYDGVGYWQPERYVAGEHADLAVCWRQPAGHRYPVDARARVLWCHDLNYGPDVTADMAVWEKVFGVSSWHADMLRAYYDLPANKVESMPNGIDLHRFARQDVVKVPWRCVYASSPDRGLLILLRLWPFIAKNEPGAELHLAYGWDSVDRAIERGHKDLIALKAEIEQKIRQTPQVVWRGRLPQNELAQLYAESYAWLYPSDFLEVSCISAMEAMAGGAVPVCSSTGALKETVGKAGVMLPGPVHSPAWQDFYIHCARAVLGDPDLRKPLEYAARARAKQFTWDASYEKWKAFCQEILAEKKTGSGVAA